MVKNLPAKDDTLDSLTENEVLELLDADADLFRNFRAVAKELGIDERVAERMIMRKRTELQPVLGPLKAVKAQDLIRNLEDRAARALDWLDDAKLAASSAKDLAIITGILLEKRQLLRGEPTQILSVEERANLNDLSSQLLKEAQRRGMEVNVIDGEFTEISPSEYETTGGKRMHFRNPHEAVRNAQIEQADASGETQG